ncbi:hypothetical protein [Lactobacillus crispatus]|nr:hypothetical protein [Lactobacillus crispatus]
MAKKVTDDLAALNENEFYAESEKELRELLRQSKKLDIGLDEEAGM